MRGCPRTVAAVAGLLVVAVAAVSGCGTMRGGRAWGAEAIAPFDWKRIPAAAKSAALDPVTWVPAAGALAVSIDGLDARGSAWASRRCAVFGSRAAARGASDHLRNLLLVEAHVTALLTPSGAEPRPWLTAKLKGMAVEEASLLAVDLATDGLKALARRERPDGLDRRSFPSGHASMAFAGARVSNRNLDAIGMRPAARAAIQSANLAAATAVGWARVEGRRHYLSDVLVGAAIGNFLSAFVHDAFIGLDREEVSIDIGVDPAAHGVRCALRRVF